VRLAPVLAAAALALSACQAGTTQSGTPPTANTSALTGAPTSTTIGSVHRVRLHVTVMPWRLPQPLAREALSCAGGARVTVAGGMIAGDASTAAAYVLDLTTGRVTRLPSLAVPVHDTAGWCLDGNPVAIGGGNATEQDAVQERRGRRWQVVGHLPHTRSDLVVESVGGRAFALGGYNGTGGAEPAILTSTDGRRWDREGRLPVPVRYGAGVVAVGAMWLFGGEVDHVMQTAVQRIDADGHARVVARLPQPLGHASAVLLGDRILLVGGRTGTTTQTGRMWWFDPATARFTRAGRLPTTLTDSAVVGAGRAAYLVGGETPGISDRVVRLTFR
jgi:hypothetical protein